MGLSPAVSWMASLKALCLSILSPPVPGIRPWSSSHMRGRSRQGRPPCNTCLPHTNLYWEEKQAPAPLSSPRPSPYPSPSPSPSRSPSPSPTIQPGEPQPKPHHQAPALFPAAPPNCRLSSLTINISPPPPIGRRGGGHRRPARRRRRKLRARVE